MKMRAGIAALLLVLAVTIGFAADNPLSSTANSSLTEPDSGYSQAASLEAGAEGRSNSAARGLTDDAGAWGSAETAAAAKLAIAGSAPHASSKTGAEGLRAAFVRSNALWIQIGSAESRLTAAAEKEALIRYPKWSSDGRWIAYTKELNGVRELHIIEAESRVDHAVGPVDGYYEWSPSAGRLAFVHNGELSWFELQAPSKPIAAAKEISSFSWLPDGSGFFASTQAKPIGAGSDTVSWTQVKLIRIPLAAAGDPSRFETVYTLPKPSHQLFAVGTSPFRWSADGRWIAFLATPTASLSADGNALCIVSSDGRVFRRVDEMVNNPEWFEWSPAGETLAYIGGGGRMATSNKQLRTIADPSAAPVNHTPQGKVEQGFAWDGPKRIIVSRAAESEWDNDPAKRPFPALFAVDLGTNEQRPLTEAAKAASAVPYGEYDPNVLSKGRLAWVQSDRSSANAMLAGRNGKHAAIWIRSLDLGDNYYEQWRWDAVLAFDKQSLAKAKK